MDNIYITDKLKVQTYLFGPPANVFFKHFFYFDIFVTKIKHYEVLFTLKINLKYKHICCTYYAILNVQQSTFMTIFRLLLIQLDK